MNQIVFPPESESVIDVTRAPYSLDNTGQRDCTESLVHLLEEMAHISIDGMARVMERLRRIAETESNRVLPDSFENAVRNGVLFGIFPDPLPPSRILYFPKGIYRVSDTICYRTHLLKNGMGAELFWRIRFVGESRTETVIRLEDHCRGFEYGSAKPVISFMRGNGSNVAMSNYVRNLTVDVGKGNPGAVGIDFFGNNTAAVRDVTLRSGDPEGLGRAGLTISRPRASGCVFKRMSIEGFDIGILLQQEGTDLVFEEIDLKGQRVTPIVVEGPVVCMRRIRSRNPMPALKLGNHNTHLVLLDSEFTGGDADAPAIEMTQGQAFMRNIRTRGYGLALGGHYSRGWPTAPIVEGSEIDEYSSAPPVTLTEGADPRSLSLDLPDEPDIPWESDFSLWVHPGEYGAAGDGEADDTEAVQRAMNSGKPVVYFQPGRYRIDSPVRIPDSVRRVNFMFCDLVAGPSLREMKNRGMFKVEGMSDQPLLMEDLFGFERNYGHHFLVDHASTRTLLLRDLHSQACSIYRNSVPGGTVFIENVCCTSGIFNPGYDRPCFEFIGQTVWCRQLDPEYSSQKVVNDGGQLFILGYKTEGHGVAFTTRNGGRSEILGGILMFGKNDGRPVALNDNSDVCLVGSTGGREVHHIFDVPAREIRGETVLEARPEQFPVRFGSQYAIPLYVGRARSGDPPRE